MDLTPLAYPSPHRIDIMKKAQDIDKAIDSLTEYELREFVRSTVKELFTTANPVWNDETEEEEDHGLRVLLDGEDFPSGADFIDYFCHELPIAVARACSPD